ncbi:MAG: lipoate protein ligase C-terminal domain-containing protein [Candidatus Thorarchaeota archaeon]|jgi:lipoate-protein ligase A
MESQKVIMMSYYSHKVPGGKLIKVRIESRNESIQKITLLGDFFLHPEDVLEKIEESLMGVYLSEDAIIDKLEAVLEENQATLIGADAKDFAQAIIAAWIASNRNS